MSKRFPRAQVEVTYNFDAFHAVPESKHPESATSHKHTWWITIGYHHERNGPFTWDREDLHGKFCSVIDQLEGADLNILCGESASDEVLASWILTRLPGWVDFVMLDRLTPNERCIKSVTTVRRRDLQ